MSFIDSVKLALRVDDDDFLDIDINETIEACKIDMEFSGVSKEKIEDTDSLILRAVKLFCKAEFSTDDKESSRYKDAYETLKIHLVLSSDYRAGES